MAIATETPTLADLENEVIVLNITVSDGPDLFLHGQIAGRVRFVRRGEPRVWVGDFCLPPYAEVDCDEHGEYDLRVKP